MDRRTVVKGLVVTAGGALLGLSCGDDADDSGAPPAGGAGDGDELLGRLESGDGALVLTDVYAASGRDGAPALVLGTHGGAAVAYLCDPIGEGRWFSGTVDGTRATLTGIEGGELTADIDGASVAAVLRGSGDYDGEYALQRSDSTTVSRARPDGDSVAGGLIVDGFVATGAFTTFPTTSTVSRPVSSTTASTVVSAAVGRTGLGIRIVAGASVDIAITLTLPAALAGQRAAIQSRLDAQAADLRAMAQAAADAVRRSESQSDCTKVVSVVAAVVIVVVAVVIAAVSFGGAADAPLLLTSTAGASLASASLAGRELTTLIRSGNVLGALEAFVERNDPTTSQLILQTLRRARTRSTSTSTTTTTVTRPFPNAGTIAFAVR